MSFDRLKKGLAITPFKSLIPTQGLAPLISSTSIDTITDDFNEEFLNPNFHKFHSEINRVGKYDDIVNYLVDEYISFTHDELDDLVFKNQRPALDPPAYASASAESQHSPHNLTQIETYIENRIFQETPDLPRTSIKDIFSEMPEELTAIGYNQEEAEVDMSVIVEDRTLESSPAKRQTYVKADEQTMIAFRDFRQLVDQLESEELSNDSNTWVDSEKRLVSSDWLQLLHDRLLRLVGKPTLQEIELNLLQKVQSVCLASIVERVDNQDASTVVHNLDLTLNSLLASKIILLILQNRNDKKLYVDEYLKSAIDLNYNMIETYLVSKFKSPSSSTDVDSVSPATMSLIFSYIRENMLLLSDYVTANKVDEHLLTKLEYLSFYTISTDSSRNEALDSLRWTASSLLSTIFKKYPDQRSFILEEALNGFGGSQPLKTYFKISRGSSIQMITVILLGLIQTFDVSKYSKAAGDVISSDGDNMETLLYKRILNEDLKNLIHQAESTCKDITNLLMIKLNRIGGKSESLFKENFESLVSNLIYLLPFPEWTVSEMLLNCIMKELMKLIEVGNFQSAIIETFALEMIGQIGINIAKSQATLTETANIDFEMNYILTLEQVRFLSNKNGFYNSSWQFLLLRYICQVLKKEDGMGENGNHSTFLTSDTYDCLDSSAYTYLILALYESNIPLRHLSDSDSDSAYLPVLHSFKLYENYQSFVNIIIQSLNSSKVKMRSRTIKIISALSEIDPRLIRSIQESLSQKLEDPSPMVRDSILDLISNILKPLLINQFYPLICERLSDSSIQVRKRLIKLCKEMYDQIEGPDKRKVRSYIGIKLLRRLEDEEEVIVDTVNELLGESWFNDVANKAATNVSNVGSWDMVQVLMDIVSSPATKTVELFERFIIDILPNYTSGIKKIVDKITDFILLKEGGSKDDIDDDVEKSLKLLSMFVKINGSLMSQDQLISLQPILVDERNKGESICYYTLQVLKNVLQEVGVLRKDFLESIELSILKRLTKFNSRELNEAMACIWKLCSLSGNTIKLVNASITCLRHVKPYINQLKLQNSKALVGEGPKIRKLLNLLGGFGKYGLFEDHREVFSNANVGLKSNESVISLLAKVLLFFANASEELRRSSIKNLVGICSSHPNLFVSETVLKVLDKELQSDSSVASSIEIKLTIVEGVIEFLQKEDRESRKRQKGDQSKNGHKKVNLDGGNSKFYITDSICASITQRFIPYILPLCFSDTDGKLSLIPIKFLQLVVKLGFANPKVCIPLIIALESTTNNFIKQLAIEMHKDLFEKHESLTDSSYVEAIKLAVSFRQKCSKTTKFFNERFFLKNLYSIICYNRASRKKFIQSICKVFTIGSKISEIKKSSRDLIVYTLANISTINFVASEDVYLIVHHLDKLILKEGMDILDTIKNKREDDEKIPVESFMTVQIFIGILSIRLFLLTTHNISSVQMESFNPNRIDSELKVVPRCVRIDDLLLDNCIMENDLQSPDNQIRIITNFVERMSEVEA